MDALTLFGLAAVSAMLVFYALEDRNPHSYWAWPFGVIEAIWARIAARRWQKRIAAVA